MAYECVTFTFFHMAAVPLTASIVKVTASIASLLCSAEAATMTLASLTGTTLQWYSRARIMLVLA